MGESPNTIIHREAILHLRVSHPQSMRSTGGKDGEQKKNKTASDLSIMILVTLTNISLKMSKMTRGVCFRRMHLLTPGHPAGKGRRLLEKKVLKRGLFFADRSS